MGNTLKKGSVRDSINDKRIANLKTCHQANPCKCGFDGLKQCTSNTKKPVNPVVLRSLAESLGKEEKEEEVEEKVEEEVEEKIPEVDNRVPDGMSCTVKVLGLKAKKRTWPFSTSFPDLYFKMKINGRKVKNSKDDLKPNRVYAEWKFEVPDEEHLTEEDDIIVFVTDHDYTTSSDYIGGNRLSTKNFGEELDLGDDLTILKPGKEYDYGYRSDNAKMMLDCEMKFKF